MLHAMQTKGHLTVTVVRQGRRIRRPYRATALEGALSKPQEGMSASSSANSSKPLNGRDTHDDRDALDLLKLRRGRIRAGHGQPAGPLLEPHRHEAASQTSSLRLVLSMEPSQLSQRIRRKRTGLPESHQFHSAAPTARETVEPQRWRVGSRALLCCN